MCRNLYPWRRMGSDNRSVSRSKRNIISYLLWQSAIDNYFNVILSIVLRWSTDGIEFDHLNSIQPDLSRPSCHFWVNGFPKRDPHCVIGQVKQVHDQVFLSQLFPHNQLPSNTCRRWCFGVSSVLADQNLLTISWSQFKWDMSLCNEQLPYFYPVRQLDTSCMPVG